MKVLEIPFNKFIGLESTNNGDNSIFKLEPKDEYMNHLGTIHASAMFALAEASSGEYLLKQFNDHKLDIIPVVRKVEIKYNKPANGTIYSRASIIDSGINDIIEELRTKNRVIIKVKVEIFNENTEKVFTSTFDWFIANK